MIDLEAFIITYNRSDYCQRTIDTFRDTGGDKFKLTVIDNSGDESKITGYDKLYHFPFNPSLTRVWNWSIAMAKAPWVLISNDDMIYLQGWTEHLNERHMNNARLHSRFFAFFLHRSLIRDVGWFDERLCSIYWEDTDFVRRVVGAGHPWCCDCPLGSRIEDNRPGLGHNCFKSYYDEKAKAIGSNNHVCNMERYVEKWGDQKNLPNAGGEPKWPELNWYPCAELPLA